MKHKKKGTSLAIVFIVSAAIMIMLATTFIVTSNYNMAVIARKRDLQQRITVETSSLDDTSIGEE